MESPEFWRLLSSEDEKERSDGLMLLKEEMFGLVISMIMKGGSSKEDAEEVFWDGLLVVDLEARKNRFGPKDNIQGFLKKVCKNIWLKRIRKKTPKFSNLDDYKDYISEEESGTPLFLLMDDHIKKKIIIILDQLKPGCKEILSLAFLQELSPKEIKERLKMKSLDVVKTTKNRCMKKLRDFLDGLGGKDFFY